MIFPFITLALLAGKVITDEGRDVAVRVDAYPLDLLGALAA